MSCTRSGISALGVVLALLAAPAALANPDSTKRLYGGDFWGEIVHPNQEKYELLIARATAFLGENNTLGAIPLLREAVALDPREPLGFYLLAHAYNVQRRWSECGDAFLTVEKLRPDYTPPASFAFAANLNAEAGLCLSLSGHVDEAIERYHRVAGGPLDFTQLHWNLGDCYHYLGRLDEAIDEYTLGLSAHGQVQPMLYYALGVALDRDEQIARAHDEIALALKLDPQLEHLGSPNVYYLPDADRLYYYGLAHQVAADTDPLHRLVAIAFFRKYIDAGASPWQKRAREHLAELGSTSVTLDDVAMVPATAAEKTAIIQAVLTAGPDLQKCLAGHPGVALAASMVYVPGSPPPMAPKPVRITRMLTPASSFVAASVGPDPTPAGLRDCLEARLASVHPKVAQVTRVTVTLIAR